MANEWFNEQQGAQHLIILKNMVQYVQSTEML